MPTTRFVKSLKGLHETEREVARLNAKYEGTGKSFDWGTDIFPRHNTAPRTRPHVIFCIDTTTGGSTR